MGNYVSGTIRRCYFLQNTTVNNSLKGVGSGSGSGASGIDEAAFANQDTFKDWDFTTVWKMGEGLDIISVRPIFQDDLKGELKKITVIFDYQNDADEITMEYISGTKYGELPKPTRTGYTFGGWFTETEGKGTQIQPNDTVTESLRLYAYWISVTDDDSEDNNQTGGDTSGGDNDGNNTGGASQQPSAGTTPPSTGGNNTPSTGDTTDPSTGDNTNGEDNVNVGAVSGENAPNVTISEETATKLKEEVIAKRLTPEEKGAVKNGATVDVLLSVEVIVEDDHFAADKQAAEAALTNSEFAVGIHLNIELIKLINGQPVGKITEIDTPIRVTIEVPEALRSTNRTFAIVRVHNGTAEMLEDVDSDPDTITIVTDKFSTYSIAYQDTDAPASDNPDTGVATSAAILVLAGAVTVTALKKKR